MNKALSILKQYWQFDAFRDLQAEIIQTVCSGRDCLALLPTGGGKSVCYQVPALLQEGLVIVVSPLVSLMQDQVSSLKEKDIAAEYLHGGLRYDEIKTILESAEKGHIRLLYLSPERIQSRLFREYLPGLPLSLIAIDEAHCISQWGHDFRPEFLQVNSLKEAHPHTPVLALTASATEAVMADIRQQLHIEDATLFRKSFARPNIRYAVQYSENKYQFLVRYFQAHKGSGIIYCRSRRKTEELALLLQQNDIGALPYHAGMSREQRSHNQESWMQDKTPVIVATTAFGMGIDKSAVRNVIHFDPPEHLEAYYQETGRAGRDGQASEAIALYHHPDLERLAESTSLYFPPADYLRKVYQAVCDFLQIPTGMEEETYYDFDLQQFLANFRLEPVPATHALRILAQEGLWTLSDAFFRPATVQFVAPRQVLDDIQQRYPLQALVSTGLLRLYGGLFHYPSVVRLPSLARHLKMNLKDVESALQQLQQMGILEYKPAKDGPQLHFHHYRVPSKDLLLNYKRIGQLRAGHEARTKEMLRFLVNEQQCRNYLLLRYFDEEAPERCTHCDICLRKAQAPVQNLEHILTELVGVHQPVALADLLSLSGAERSEAISQIRRLVDEGMLQIDERSRISMGKG